MTTATSWRTVSLYDEVGPYGVTAAEIIAELEAEPGPVELRICSPGGSATEALGVYQRMRQRVSPVRVVVDGFAASCATIIACGATRGELACSEGSLLMVHSPWVGVTGPAPELRKAADVLDTMAGEMAAIYSRRTGHGTDTWLALMADETWFTAAEAAGVRLVDYVL